MVLVMRKYTHFVGANLSEEQFQQYQVLLKRFGKTWRATKSEHFRELIRRLSSELTFETKWDNQPFDSFDEPEAEEQEHVEGPDPEVVVGESEE